MSELPIWYLQAVQDLNEQFRLGELTVEEHDAFIQELRLELCEEEIQNSQFGAGA